MLFKDVLGCHVTPCRRKIGFVLVSEKLEQKEKFFNFALKKESEYSGVKESEFNCVLKYSVMSNLDLYHFVCG